MDLYLEIPILVMRKKETKTQKSDAKVGLVLENTRTIAKQREWALGCDAVREKSSHYFFFFFYILVWG